MTTAHPLAVGGAPGKKPFPRRFTSPLYVGSSLNPVNSSLMATALVPIATGLHVSVGSTSVLVSSLYLASAVAQPTAGKLAEVLGPRRVFLTGILVVLAGGLVGGSGRNLATLTVARVLIGIGTSAGFPSAMVLIRRRATAAGMKEPPGRVLGGLAIAGMATTAVGPPLGGLLVGAAGWRWAFLINVPVTAAALAMALLWIPADPRGVGHGGPRRLAGRIDLTGLLGFAASMTALVVLLAGLPRLDVSALVVFVVVGPPTWWWELRARTPFLDLRQLLGNGALTRTYLRQALTLLGAYTVMYGMTQWIEEARGLSAPAAGLLLVPMGALSALLSGPLSSRNILRGSLVAAAVSMLVGALGILVLGSGSSVILILAVSLVFGVTIATTTVGNQTALYLYASPTSIGSASGLFRTFGYLGTIASAVISSIVFRDGVSDEGLHTLGAVLVAAGAAVLLLTVCDRRLMTHRMNHITEETNT
ncbi:MFS transporter [Actinacidiphila sp. DG2A-62]|uniref:MFS transporter n=1 Tax=Actinacidiphila sp. DG2A-62 TaxID=3108821 RepID=UPI002DBD6AC1|nr:MFS transporter [Actinacidiphila sp. DG2A-62]MEC3995386.1 MFS transporter [Actinacidiphila sp. DG2A-62]